MDGDDILTHLDTMAKYYERLNSIISPENPLTANNVYTAALLTSIPQDWLHCILLLMNQDGVKSETIFKALKNENTRCQSQTEVKASVSSTKSKQSSNSNNRTPKHCYFCNVDCHNLNNCNKTKKVLNKLKSSRKQSQDHQQPKKPVKNSQKSSACACRTTVTTITQTANHPNNDEQSDYSGL